LQETDTKELNVTECSQHDAKQQGKAKRYGKYTVQSTFAGSCSITDVMMIIPELSEPPVRTLGATIPENESHIFR